MVSQKEIKQKLRNIAEWRKRLEVRANSIKDERELLESISAVRYDKEVVGGGGNKDKFAESVAKLIDEQNEIIEEYARYKEERTRLCKSIERIDNAILQELLINKYILCKSWKAIEEEMHYSEGGAFKQHSKALMKLAEKFED